MQQKVRGQKKISHKKIWLLNLRRIENGKNSEIESTWLKSMTVKNALKLWRNKFWYQKVAQKQSDSKKFNIRKPHSKNSGVNSNTGTTEDDY